MDPLCFSLEGMCNGCPCLTTVVTIAVVVNTVKTASLRLFSNVILPKGEDQMVVAVDADPVE
jgi:hypothetical protein